MFLFRFETAARDRVLSEVRDGSETNKCDVKYLHFAIELNSMNIKRAPRKIFSRHQQVFTVFKGTAREIKNVRRADGGNFMIGTSLEVIADFLFRPSHPAEFSNQTF